MGHRKLDDSCQYQASREHKIAAQNYQPDAIERSKLRRRKLIQGRHAPCNLLRPVDGLVGRFAAAALVEVNCDCGR
jgi:hypothetical protein